MRPDGEEALRVAQEVDDLAQFELGLVDTCDIGKSGLWAFFRVEPGAAMPDPEEPSPLQVLHLAHTAPAHHAEVEQE